MPRFMLKQGPIRINYGYDHVAGYFFELRDERLGLSAFTQQCSVGYSNICHESLESETGLYLSLCTEKYGLGRLVSHAVMEEFWTRYGVDGVHIRGLKRGIDFQGGRYGHDMPRFAGMIFAEEDEDEDEEEHKAGQQSDDQKAA